LERAAGESNIVIPPLNKEIPHETLPETDDETP